MAKIKKAESDASATEQKNAQEAAFQTDKAGATEAEAPQSEEVAEQVEKPANEQQPKEESDAPQPETGEQSQEKAPIPNEVLAYLKRHTEEKEVYIDKLGGVFSAKTPKVFLKGALLYQNPFFKQ